MQFAVSSSSSTPMFVFDLENKVESHKRLMQWVENMVEGEVEKEVKLEIEMKLEEQAMNQILSKRKQRRQEPIKVHPIKSGGKLYVPKKGVFLVKMKYKDMEIILLYELSGLYFKAVLSQEYWFHFGGFDTSQIPSESEFFYKDIIAMDIDCSYGKQGGLGNNDVIVGDKPLINCLRVLFSLVELDDTPDRGYKILSVGPLALPAVIVSECLRDKELREWTQESMILPLGDQVPPRLTIKFNQWNNRCKVVSTNQDTATLKLSEVKPNMGIMTRTNVVLVDYVGHMPAFSMKSRKPSLDI